jgi:hypothetical protein
MRAAPSCTSPQATGDTTSRRPARWGAPVRADPAWLVRLITPPVRSSERAGAAFDRSVAALWAQGALSVGGAGSGFGSNPETSHDQHHRSPRATG